MADREAGATAHDTHDESADSFEDAQEANTEDTRLAKSEDTIRKNSTLSATDETNAPGKSLAAELSGFDSNSEGAVSPTQSHHDVAEARPTLAQPPLPERSVSPSHRLSRPVSFARERSGSPNKGKRLSMGIPIRPSSTISDISSSHLDRPNDDHSDTPTSPIRQPDQPIRKPSSGLAGLLGRMSSMRRSANSPPDSKPDKGGLERRTTGLSARSEGGLNSVLDEEFERVKRRSLKDQFRYIREQGEQNATDATDGEKTPVSRKWSDASTTSATPSESSAGTSTSQAPNAIKSPTFNPNLPPGTAAGVLVGPTTNPTTVDWDLWQAVVYEGPAAVTRSSGEELNQAIASGIPPAIRGVVWQVLAESKNEDLEAIYRTLKARGPDLDETNTPALSRSQSQVINDGDKDGDATPTSGATQEKSFPNSPTRSVTSSQPPEPSINGTSNESRTKLLIEKQKREAAAIAKLEKVIKRDMGTRTSFSKYVQAAGLQDGLFGICKAYALFDEGVGYAQGINFITMPLLFNMSEEEAFTLLVRLMSKYDVRSLFTADMPGLHLRLYQFERLLEDFEPALCCHLKRRSVSPQLYATQWFLTLFAYRFPLQLVLRIYDLIFSAGLGAIFQFGIVLMQKNRSALLEMKEMGQLTTFLKEKLFDVYIDKSPSASSILDSGFFGAVTGGVDKEVYRADDLVRDACAIEISAKTLTTYAAEWEELQRAERERTEELERLRVQSASMSIRIKALEEQVQQQDVEHVTIAGDLVRCKVRNDDLLDENEGLKIKVVELQRMVDLQPGEVESRLKDEMDRIMQRNIEVQNENRALREEMDDVENELVKTKMSNAEIQAEHETLKQKWSSVQALLNAGQ